MPRPDKSRSRNETLANRKRVFSKNMLRRAEGSIVLAQKARMETNNRTKSLLFRSACFLLSTAIEALAFDLACRKSKSTKGIIGSKECLKKVHEVSVETLKRSHLDIEDPLIIALKENTIIHIDDRELKFDDLVRYLNSSGILDRNEIRSLKKVQGYRNSMAHFYGSESDDIGYTHAKFNSLIKTASMLADKL